MWQNPLGSEAIGHLDVELPEPLALRATYYKARLLASGRLEEAAKSCTEALSKANELGETALALELEIFEIIDWAHLGHPKT